MEHARAGGPGGRRLWVRLAGAACLVLLAGCGSGGESVDASATATARFSEGMEGLQGGIQRGIPATVTMTDGQRFEPPRVTVPAGTTVRVAQRQHGPTHGHGRSGAGADGQQRPTAVRRGAVRVGELDAGPDVRPAAHGGRGVPLRLPHSRGIGDGRDRDGRVSRRPPPAMLRRSTSRAALVRA